MGSVQMSTSRTTVADPEQAAEDLVRQLDSQLNGKEPVLVTMFAERSRDQRALNAAVRARLPKHTRLIGSTANGQIDRSGTHQGSVVLGALSGDFTVGIGMGKGLSTDAARAGSAAIKQASEELGVRQADLNTKRHLGLVIDDGYRMKKEELLLGVLEKSQGLVLVGGGASDSNPDDSQKSAEIHVDGEVATDAALVALFDIRAPWAALRTHAYTPTGRTMTITKVDETGTRALEIDGKPAAQRYADLLGTTIDGLHHPQLTGFTMHPTALRVGHEYFIRSPWAPLPDGSVLFANLLVEDTELEIMQLGDIAEITEKFIREEMPRKVENPSAAIFFHCSARAFVAGAHGKMDQLSNTFRHGPPTVGLNCYFEIYCGFHINTTLTSLVFGSNK